MMQNFNSKFPQKVTWGSLPQWWSQLLRSQIFAWGALTYLIFDILKLFNCFSDHWFLRNRLHTQNWLG